MLKQATSSGPRSRCTQRYGGQPNAFRSIQPEEEQTVIGEHITLEGEEIVVEHAIVQHVVLDRGTHVCARVSQCSNNRALLDGAELEEDTSCGYQH